ncbi:MAG TPA: hypothetical protein O0X32_02990 [Methanocorpusculum sp.]|nr:hypothetical protein [Methanocorpusculum sp.]
MSQIHLEIVGYTYRPCGPFPCDKDRTCELSECYGKEKLSFAFSALKTALTEKYGDKLSIDLVSLDNEIPEWVKEIVKAEHPPLPIILINRKVVPVGAISVPKISEFINAEL